MVFISYAQNFEDVMLWRAFRDVRQGFYIDVGAAHPDTDSVTRAFYDRGWRGINIEPSSEFFPRLRAARQQDINLNVAVGAQDGKGILNRVSGSGLSTMNVEVAAANSRMGWLAEKTVVDCVTLAGICRLHAPADIHFLKVDVEGAERDVLMGADFRLFRPWVVLVEATRPMSQEPDFAAWEPILLAADYRFAWFDGLNRFYLAAEHDEALRPHFLIPPNVFDGFLRAVDTEAAIKIAESQVLAEVTGRHLETTARQLKETENKLHAAEQHGRDIQQRLQAEMNNVANLQATLGKATNQASQAQDEVYRLSKLLESMYLSTSWRLTWPVRHAKNVASRLIGRNVAGIPAPAPEAVSQPQDQSLLERRVTPIPGAASGLRAVHQFHSGSNVGDAITNAMLLTQAWLQKHGYDSEIYVQHRDPLLSDSLLTLDDIPSHADYVLIVRHSMGHDECERLLALPAPKILLYHNITPAEFFDNVPSMASYATLGRRQLDLMRPHMRAALADSEYNALELRRTGYAAPLACSFLFDVDAMLARASSRAPRQPDAPFTVMFIGRVVTSKGQADLVDAFAAFRLLWDAPCRLVLVGDTGAADAAYPAEILRRIAAHGLGEDDPEASVRLTGRVSDELLHQWYGAADLYVSLSHHEGFGVPLAEAMAYDIPILAWPAGAIPYTLGGASELLTSRAPDDVAAAMLRLAHDPTRRAAIVAKQRRQLEEFRLDRQAPRLIQALAAAGAAMPDDPRARHALAENCRFTITGHVLKTYSLSTVNRQMALALEARRPGTVRIEPVEVVPITDLSEVPAWHAVQVGNLVARPIPVTAPEIVISQHYPLHVPLRRGDAAMAMLFWEESLLPEATVQAINRGFEAVLAPTACVAKTLLDSGVAVPVACVGFAPDLTAFHALGMERARLPNRGDRPVTFLHVSSCFPRKGVDLLLAAFATTFRESERVRLVIKGFPNPHNDVAEQIAALQRAQPDLPEIVFINEDLDQEALLALYRQADVAVLPTRGEGFNIPAAEAMAAGLPLIVTGYGGHLDFCGPDTARLLAFRFAPASTHLSSVGSVWAEPDMADLGRAMREAFVDLADGDGLWQRRAARAQMSVQLTLNATAWADRLVAIAVDLLTARRYPPLRVGWVSSWDVPCGVAEYSRFLLADFAEAEVGGGGVDDPLILCDTRTPASAKAAPVRQVPCWSIGAPDGIDHLAATVAAENLDALVIQHQPGLLPWSDLAAVLSDRRVRRRITVVTLHNARQLLDVGPEERAAVLSGLRLATRVLVHRAPDLDLMKELGLTANVTLFPQGAHKAAASANIRPLTQDGREGPVIGCYGFFLPGKGVQRLINAVATLRRTWPAIRLRLVNAEYPAAASAAEIATCRTLATSLDLGDAIEWHTQFLANEQSLKLLAGCDLIVLPYDESKESSSAAVRLAMASGVPVAVTPVAVFDEIGDAVGRFASLDTAAVADGIAALLLDQTCRRRLQQDAATWLAERDWSKLAYRMRNMLLGLRASRATIAAPAARAADGAFVPAAEDAVSNESHVSARRAWAD